MFSDLSNLEMIT